MSDHSDVRSATKEYEALRALINALEKSDYDIPENLLERRSILVQRLIDAPAATTDDLARKAIVLSDWAEPDDMTGALTVSLCRDTIRLFPVPESGIEADDGASDPISPTMSYEDLMKIAQSFTNRV